MQSRKADKEEKIWLNLIAQLPCIVCDFYYCETDSPAETHHLEGKTKPKAHLKTIRLCHKHHRVKDNNNPQRWVSLHGDGKNKFKKRYMDLAILLKMQVTKVEELKSSIV
jgi:hypothetical protein